MPVKGSNNPFLLYPFEIPPGAGRILLVGDSGVIHLGPALRDRGKVAGLEVATSSRIPCTVVNPEGTARGPDGRVNQRKPCHKERRKLWGDLIHQFDPDVVVYYLANAGGLGEARLGGRWLLDCDPAYDAYLQGALQTDARLLQRRGAYLIFATTPNPAVPSSQSPRRVDCRNRTYRTVAASLPHTGVIDLRGFVRSRRSQGVHMFRDAIHLSAEGARLTAEWMVPQLDAVLARR